MFPDYKNPPVIEVASGIVFEQIKNFRGPHAGLLWSKLRDEFPACEHAAPLEFKPSSDEWPLPRFWFINDAGDNLIQLQDDRFYFNWRRRDESQQYPRYRIVISSLRKYFSILSDFLTDTGLDQPKPLRCELTYINQIPKGCGWETVRDTTQLFPALSWIFENRFLPNPIHLGWQGTFALPDSQGHLGVRLHQAARKADQHPLLVLDLSATGLGEDKSLAAVWKWFDLAHEFIVRGFSELTSDKIQKDIWKRHDESQER